MSAISKSPIFAPNVTHEICIDMDGPTVDLDGYFERLFGTSLWNMTVEEKHRHWDEMFEPEWFLEAPMKHDFPVLIKFILDNFTHVRFLTALPHRRKDKAWQSMVTKIAWIHRHVGHRIPVTFGPYAEDKQKHCGGPTFVLIDDRKMNIEQWGAAGGIAIYHTSALETIEALAQYLKVIAERQPFGRR